MKVKNPVLATDYRAPGSSEMFVGNNGEVNASNKQDLLRQQLKLLTASANGEVSTMERMQRAQRNRDIVSAMFNSDAVHQELGEVMAKDLYQAANRRGFCRKFLARQDLVNGQFPTVKLRLKDVIVTYSTSPTKTETQVVRDKLFMPPEIVLEARPFVEQREINTSVGDVLDEKYAEALKSVPRKLAAKLETKELGKKTGKGFYVWVNGKPQKGAAGAVPAGLTERLITPMLNEANKALTEGVVTDSDFADAGAIFGCGFAPFTGGPFNYQRSKAA